jgi:phenylacetate-CoA ligase
MRSKIIDALNIGFTYVRYASYLKFPFKRKEDIEAFQVSKLRSIVQIAVTKVPFYKKYKDVINLEEFSLEELNKFPVVTKDLIRKDPSLFIREDILENKIRWKSTSGSSGKPFQVAKCFFSDGIEVILGYRAWSFGRFVYKLREPAVVLRSFSPKENEPIFKRNLIRNFWYLSPYHINEKHLPLFLEVFKKSKAKVLKGYPSSIYILTLLLKKNNIRLEAIQTIITSSENMIPQYRDEINNYWGCDVLDWYGQNERTVTVQQCEYGNYHNNDDYGICEVVENNQIIGTSLNNDIMPLIRYQTNDIAVPLDSVICNCKCGRNTSIPFKAIQGRSDDILYREGKEPIPTINFYNLLEKFQNIRQFHILQNEDLSIVMRISENSPISKMDLANLKTGLKQRVGNIPIEIIVVDEIKRNVSTDKIKIIESKVKENE